MDTIESALAYLPAGSIQKTLVDIVQVQWDTQCLVILQCHMNITLC